VGADAFQVYAGLPLLTAKPPPELRARVPHHLIGEIPLSESFNVGRYLSLASERLAEIRGRGRVPVIVGGTGLYVRALTRGLAELPTADEALRAELERAPLEELCERLRELDPVGATWIDLRNPRRVVRALEVCLLSGRPFSSFREEWSGVGVARMLGAVLVRERAELYERIDRRVEEMFREGVIEEVRAAGEIGATAGQTLGLAEIQAHLRGEISAAEAVAAIQQATRKYAKRQMTWFRREEALAPVEIGAGKEREVIEKIVALAGAGD
jgi:tRNA dimethylallyltransferase